jgi:hypothetical protein
MAIDGRCVLVSSHQLAEMQRTADRAARRPVPLLPVPPRLPGCHSSHTR